MKYHGMHNRFWFLLTFIALLAGSPEASKIRVLAAFTEQAEAQGFSPSTAAYGINGIVREVYENSSPNYSGYQMPDVELAGTVKVTYSGSQTEPAKAALRSKTDNKMDEIHALRDWYRADIVILFHPFTDHGGSAYGIEIDHEDKAFAVVTVPFYSSSIIAHEIGHLVGCIHDFQDPWAVYPSIAYAYGYVGPANAWGTVMTYHSNRKPWFSNPYEYYNGAARGIVDTADCTRKHHERKSTFASYRTTPSTVTMTNLHLEENESVFWNLPGPIYFVGTGGASSTLNGSLVSLRSDQNVYYLGFPHAQIVAQEASTYLKSPKTVELSGEHGLWSTVITVSDTLKFPVHTETIFRSMIANLSANVLYHQSGADVSIETDPSDTFGSYIMVFARNKIRLSNGFKIRSRSTFLRVSDDLDPFENEWEHILDKSAVSAEVPTEMAIAFQTRVVQEMGGLSLEYRLPERGPLSVQVFDLKGQLAGSVNVRHPRPGTQSLSIPGKFENGTVYFLRVVANGQVQTHRFVKGM